ncbi:MAG: hypothetical protein ACM3ZC_02200 [Bacteroidota bacterium]
MKPKPRLALPLVLVLLISLPAGAAKMTWGFRQDGFRFEAILSVGAKDLDRDGRPELIISGRNYLDREAYIEVYRWENKAFVPVWRTPNLEESESTLFALPVTWPDGPALVALTRTSYHIFRWRNGAYTKESSGPVGVTAEEAAAGDLDGDGSDDLVISTTLRNTKSWREKNLRFLSWRNGRLELGPASEAVGNIRALAVGDLNRDRRAEVVTDTGAANAAGEFRVFSYAEAWRQIASAKAPMPAASYGFTIGRLFPEPGIFLLAACQPGKLRGFRLTNAGLTPAGVDLSYQGSPVGMTTADLDADGREEVVVAGFPARIQILFPAASRISITVDGVEKSPIEPLQNWEGTVFAEAGDLANILGFNLSGTADRASLTLAGPDGQSHTLTVTAGSTATYDGAPIDLGRGGRLYGGYLYLPVQAVASLAGYETIWEETRSLLSLRRATRT